MENSRFAEIKHPQSRPGGSEFISHLLWWSCSRQFYLFTHQFLLVSVKKDQREKQQRKKSPYIPLLIFWFLILCSYYFLILCLYYFLPFLNLFNLCNVEKMNLHYMHIKSDFFYINLFLFSNSNHLHTFGNAIYKKKSTI